MIAVNDVFLDKKLLRKNPELKVSILSSDEGDQFYKLRAYTKDSGYDDIIKGYHVFDGVDWPEAGYLAAALTEILIEDETPAEEVQQYYESDLAFGELLYKKQQHLYAFDFVGSLKNKYKKRVDLKVQKSLLKTIRSNSSYRSKQNQLTLFKYTENALAQDFQYYLLEDSKNVFF